MIATGARDVFPSFPGSWLPGVLSFDLMERYAALGLAPGRRLLLAGGGKRAARLADALRGLGAEHVSVAEALVTVSGTLCVERAVADDEEYRVDGVAIAAKRVPSLEIAKALGCRTHYDRKLGDEVLELDDNGRTSERGIFAVGGAART